MKTMRDKFEELPEIALSLADGEIYFDEKEDCYIATDVEFYYDAGYANGARYAFREQQKKIDAIEQLVNLRKAEGNYYDDYIVDKIEELLNESQSK